MKKYFEPIFFTKPMFLTHSPVAASILDSRRVRFRELALPRGDRHVERGDLVVPGAPVRVDKSHQRRDPGLKDSFAERPYHSNFSDKNSVKILSEFSKISQN